MDKLVSIVLPVYNGEKYLAQSIESVLNQTYKNIELIIVNDCSTDSSEEIILKYKSQDDRIVYIKNDVNSKLPQSLNNGFAVAKGEYYSWTSDDNLYHDDAIETMVDFLENHSEIGLVYCDYNVIDENGLFQQTVKVGEPKELKFGNCIGACFLYRSTIIDNLGEYDASFFLVEDYEYWLRISLHYRLEPLHVVLYDYRIHKNSLTETKKELVEIALNKLKLRYIREYERKKIDEQELIYLFMQCISKEKSFKKRFLEKTRFALKHRIYLIYLKTIIASLIKKKK